METKRIKISHHTGPEDCVNIITDVLDALNISYEITDEDYYVYLDVVV